MRQLELEPRSFSAAIGDDGESVRSADTWP
jgi:hypothetical protein